VFPASLFAILLLIDLDFFKRINDTHGHPTGDRVLALLGEALRSAARQNDTVCCYGGEEFALLIAGGSPGIAKRSPRAEGRADSGSY
jgi:diguanylate cyclase (GGDEF)-like protein